MPARIPVEVDGPTVRLLALSRAVSAEGSLPAASAKSLGGLVRAVRLYAEAWEPDLALGALNGVEAFALDLDTAGAQHADPALSAALKRHVGTLRKSLGKM